MDLHPEAGVEKRERSSYLVDLRPEKGSEGRERGAGRTEHELVRIVGLRAQVAENRRKGADARSASCVAERFDEKANLSRLAAIETRSRRLSRRTWAHCSRLTELIYKGSTAPHQSDTRTD